MSGPPFHPSPELGTILNALLDQFERRRPPVATHADLRPDGSTDSSSAAGLPTGGPFPAGRRAWALRCPVDPASMPGYFDQGDPGPRQTANEQLQLLEQLGWVQLDWLPGEARNLLATVTLKADHAGAVFGWLGRPPLAAQRARLADLLLGERFRFSDWRRRAIQNILGQLRAEKSAAPFSLADEVFNQDVLAALVGLDDVHEETPYRVFSVRVFNDSKRFEALMSAVVTLARQGQPGWAALGAGEVLRELNLVANPGHLFLAGAWQLTDAAGRILTTEYYHPSLGIPSLQVARLSQATVAAAAGGSGSRVIGVENPTSFYELIRHQPAVTAVCLWGNPSPACRQLLRLLPPDVELFVWADLDYGGFNILAQVREQVSPHASPYRMDVQTLEAHAGWGRPLTAGDTRNLERLLRRPSLASEHATIRHLLKRGLKLEQEAVGLDALP